MSRGHAIVADIKLIRDALAEQGDRLVKQPRQALWVVHRRNGKSYRLTYQPAPLSAWMLYPSDPEAAQLLKVMNRALSLHDSALVNEVKPTYRQQLHPWCIVRLLPDLQHEVIARFRRRNDAEAHQRILRQQQPSKHYTIVFFPALELADFEEDERSPLNSLF